MKVDIIKIALSAVLLVPVLAGCAAGDRQRTGSGLPPATESAQSKTPEAPPEVISAEPWEADAVFPQIRPVYARNLGGIEAYCRQRGIRRLERDRVRLFIQPMGIITEAIEIELTHGQLTVYPGTHSKKEIVHAPLDEEQIAEIRALVTSHEFKQIPAENKKTGLDGTSYLVEVSIGGAYSCKLHWVPDDKEFIKVVDHIRALAKKKVTTNN